MFTYRKEGPVSNSIRWAASLSAESMDLHPICLLFFVIAEIRVQNDYPRKVTKCRPTSWERLHDPLVRGLQNDLYTKVMTK